MKAENVFKRFLDVVVSKGVFSNEERTAQSGTLRDSDRADIAAGKRQDFRTPRLAAMSGKGGWVPDAEKARRYARFTNVSLLDHLCSVVRGALVFAELDLTASGIDATELEGRLACVAAIAFLHDADKMLGVSRLEELTPEHIAVLTKRYCILEFLESFNQNIEPAILVSCIDEVEVTRLGRMREGVSLPPRTLTRDCAYVRLADRLDGKFLDTHPDEGGVNAVLKELEGFDGLRTPLAKKMRVIRIEDPHCPFLLDELQLGLSDACWERHKFTPLIELHHDGRLLCVLPEEGFEEIVTQGLRFATKPLCAGVRIDVNARGAIRLLDARVTYQDLIRAVSTSSLDERKKLLQVTKDFASQHRPQVEELFQETAFLPQWSDLKDDSRKLLPMFWNVKADDDEFNAFLVDAQTIGCTLSCSTENNGIPDTSVREEELKKCLGLSELPTWLGKADSISRRTVLAALAAAYAQQDRDLRDALLGADGIVAVWLEGRGDRNGINASIEDSGSKLAQAVERHFTALINRQLVVAEDENADGRCHFTNQPVGRNTNISTSTGLYAVNISAFSGRDGRPEMLTRPLAETLVSTIAQAEHKLRQIHFGKPSGRRGIPVSVSSPTTAGLFPALVFDRSSSEYFSLKDYAFSDLLRRKIEPDKLTFSDTDALSRRHRIARYEEFPPKSIEQIAFVRRVFEVARRTGRAVHLFRGLPRPNPAFVSFDCLPPAIELMLGDREFRLEQINQKIKFLRHIEEIANQTGFGLELAFAIGNPSARFGAACDALSRVERKSHEDSRLSNLRSFLVNLIEQSETLMSNADRAFVAFGEAMSKVQRAPIHSDGGNVSEKGLRIALEAAVASSQMRQTSQDAVTAAVAASLEDALGRGSLFARKEIRGGEKLQDALAQAVEIFVRDVWFGVLGGKSPTLKKRRVVLATYRWAFERSAKRLNSSSSASEA